MQVGALYTYNKRWPQIFFHSTATINKEKNETVKQLRDYGRFLGIRCLCGKNKEQLREDLFNSVFEEVNERMLCKLNIDPTRESWIVFAIKEAYESKNLSKP